MIIHHKTKKHFLELKELDDISFYEIKNDNIVINTDAIIVYVSREDDHTDAILNHCSDLNSEPLRF